MFGSGSMIDHFRIMRPLGRGGMGQVFLARDTQLGRRVALKVIHPERVASEAAVERFRFEARTTARFNHPNIVAIYAVGEARGRQYLALELVEGQTLRERLRDARPGLKETLRIARAMARGVAEAHRHGVLHRDLKPANVMLGADGRTRVLDFGLAKLHEHHEAAPEPGRVVAGFESSERGLRGSIPYLSPEQWQLQPLGPAVDVWAVGLILFELLFGRRPYEDDEQSVSELMIRVGADEPVPLPASTSVAPELLSLLARCLSKDPTDRPSMEVVAAELDAMLTPQRSAEVEAELSPFPGLALFGADRAEVFFGRGAEVAAFVERLRECPVLPVIGPSGGGKSSFVRAGVIPRVTEDEPWIVLTMRPGDDPFGALASRLLRSGHASQALSSPSRAQTVPDTLADTIDDPGVAPTLSEEGPSASPSPGREVSSPSAPLPPSLQQALVELSGELREAPTHLNLRLARLAARSRMKVLLFVDQLEELYTLTGDEAVRRAFLESLCAAADDPQDPVRVVFTLRDDFIGRLATSPAIRRTLGRVTVIRAPEPAALLETLEAPLAHVGYRFEDDALPREMVESVRGEPSGLPLLQFTARALWDRRDRPRRELTRSAYDQLGGVAGALARHADGVLEGMRHDQVATARRLLLGLVTAQRTRRTATRRLLVGGLHAAADAERVLDQLIAGRLVSVRRTLRMDDADSEVELVHESLVRGWGRLARWIDETRDVDLIVEDLNRAAEVWERHGCPADAVWDGDALESAQRAVDHGVQGLRPAAAAFVAAGQRRLQQRRRRRRVALIGAAVLLVAATVASLIVAGALDTRRRAAESALAVATEQHALASREGAAAALARGDIVEARAKLRQSLETRDSLEARAIWWALLREPLRWRHSTAGLPLGLGLSPDARRVAVALSDGAVHLLDAETLERAVLRGHDQPVFSAAFSPSGQHLVSGDWGGNLRVWTLVDGLPAAGASSRALPRGGDGVRALIWASSNAVLAQDDRNVVRRWDPQSAADPEVVFTAPSARPRIGLSASGGHVAYQRTDAAHVVVRRDLVTGQESALEAAPGALTPERFGLSPDGARVAAGTLEGPVVVWDATSGALLAQRRGHRGRIVALAFDAAGGQLASGSADGDIRVGRADSPDSVLLSGHEATVAQLAFAPGGQGLLSLSRDSSARWWRLDAPAIPPRADGHAGAMLGLAVNPDGRRIATAGYDRLVRVWDLTSARLLQVLEGHQAPVSAVAFTRDYRVVSASTDRTVRVWSRAGAQEQVITTGQDLKALALAPDGQTVAVGGTASTIEVLQLSTGARIDVLRGHTRRIRGLDFAPRGRLLASASADGQVRLWDLDVDGGDRLLGEHKNEVYGVAFSPDGGRLVTGSRDGTARVWDVASGTSNPVLKVAGRVYWVAFSPDGRTVLAPVSDHTLRLVPVHGGTPLVLRGHIDEVGVAAFTPDGRTAVSVADDGTLRTWDPVTGRPRWRGVLLRAAEPALLTHVGWVDVVAGERRHPPQEAWRVALEARGRLAHEAPGAEWLCQVTFDDRVEGWVPGEDRPTLARTLSGRPLVVRATSDRACVVLLDGEAAADADADADRGKTVVLLRPEREPKVLATDAAALEVVGDQVLLAAHGEARVALGGDDARTPVGPGATALYRGGSGEPWVLGFSDGSIEVDGAGVVDTPSSAVVRLIAGPPGVLVAGFADGTFGLWRTSSGERLYLERLHGAVVHLRWDGRVLLAATELGSDRALDLHTLQMPYCDLLWEVWVGVPIVWDMGEAVRRSPPGGGHVCVE